MPRWTSDEYLGRRIALHFHFIIESGPGRIGVRLFCRKSLQTVATPSTPEQKAYRIFSGESEEKTWHKYCYEPSAVALAQQRAWLLLDLPTYLIACTTLHSTRTFLLFPYSRSVYCAIDLWLQVFISGFSWDFSSSCLNSELLDIHSSYAFGFQAGCISYVLLIP